MKFKSYASSSHGNLYSVDDGQTKILLEAGISYKKMSQLLGFAISDFKGCLVSHEHKDHSKGVEELICRGMNIYMSLGTAGALNTEIYTLVESMAQFNLGSFDIVPFATFHDAKEPLGFLIKSRVDGDVLAFATDTVNLRYKFPGLTILAIEANYDRAVLDKCEKLPEKVRQRITNSHMEIDTLCDYLSSLDLSSCREIHLLHLSDATSREDEFIEKVKRKVPKNIKVKACGK